uniref:Uncharacterized protein n=1 Tax=Oryza brachyantha TaxID=4533 RepID=J3MWB2_ORYBR
MHYDLHAAAKDQMHYDLHAAKELNDDKIMKIDRLQSKVARLENEIARLRGQLEPGDARLRLTARKRTRNANGAGAIGWVTVLSSSPSAGVLKEVKLKNYRSRSEDEGGEGEPTVNSGGRRRSPEQ